MPSTERAFCSYHAIASAGLGETFEPVDWLLELGRREFENL